MRAIDGDRLKRKAQKVATEAWKMKIKANAEVILNEFIDWIDDAPTVNPQQEWIFCKDELPKESGYYVVTYIKDGYEDAALVWFAHKDDYDMDESEWREIEDDEEVIAWLPGEIKPCRRDLK